MDTGSGVVLTTGDSGDDTISGVISGAGGLEKDGSGTFDFIWSEHLPLGRQRSVRRSPREQQDRITDASAVIVSEAGDLDTWRAETVGSIAIDGNIVNGGFY